jgi:uncharacterized protein (TIGR03435 family)
MPNQRDRFGVALGCAVALWCGERGIATGAAQSDVATASFELATVRPHRPDDTGPGGVALMPGGRFEVRGLPLRALVFIAYSSKTIVAPAQVVGGPAWLDSDTFDITAKGEGTLSGPDGFTPHLIGMIRALVTERFKLTVHHDTRELQVYELVRANSSRALGPRLVVSERECQGLEAVPGPSSVDRWCGFRRTLKTGDDGLRLVDVHAQGVTMGEVALHFSLYPFVARPIFDRTGLTGRYDIVHLDYVQTRVALEGAPGLTVENPQVDSGPSLFTSLVEQLGLRLRGAKQPADVIVVDAAEPPAE